MRHMGALQVVPHARAMRLHLVEPEQAIAVERLRCAHRGTALRCIPEREEHSRHLGPLPHAKDEPRDLRALLVRRAPRRVLFREHDVADARREDALQLV